MHNPVETLRAGAVACDARVALFDFDGTLSLIRSGWVEVMVPMMVEILAELGTGESEEALTTVVREFVDRLTGKQTIYQMIHLVEEIERRGGASRDPLYYKHLYLDRLGARIAHRLDDLRAGRVSPDEYLVPGSRALLESLSRRGLRLLLASGTDEVFVRDEAALLDVARYFDGGIHGAQDDYKSFSKAIVIERLLHESGYRGAEFLGFGDGYVEIQNVRQVGGVAVGVASDEPECRRVDEWKRARLIGVGADYIVANYECLADLEAVLFPN